MARRSEREPTLMEAAVENLSAAGLSPMKANLEAARAITTVWALAVCAEKIGRWPSQIDYAAYWKVSERSAQREWADFRAAFPDEDTPDRLAQLLRARVIGRRLQQPAAAFGVAYEPAGSVAYA